MVTDDVQPVTAELLGDPLPGAVEKSFDWNRTCLESGAVRVSSAVFIAKV